MSQSSIWGATLIKAVALQWTAVAVLAAVAGLWGGNAALSLFCGGVAVILPNTLLAAWLMPRLQRADATGAVGLMVAEGLKLMATMGLMLLTVIVLGSSLVWPAMLLGLVGALVAQWVSLLVTRRF